jgi:hypothetical protein
MYNPPTFLTVEVVAAVLAEFDWPAPYALEQDEDGVVVRFPQAGLHVIEGFESDMSMTFLREYTGLDRNVALVDALVALRGERDLPEVVLIDDPEPFATLSKVRNGIQDLCTLVLAYFRPALTGDNSWTQAYLRRYGP